MGHLREESGPSVIMQWCDHTPTTPSCGLRHPIAPPLWTRGQGLSVAEASQDHRLTEDMFPLSFQALDLYQL